LNIELRRDWDKIIRRRVSIEKVRRILGYEPKAKVQGRINEIYDWIVERRDKIEENARF